MCNGMQAACSDNSCTRVSDSCIESCLNETLANLQMPILDKADAQNLTQAEVTELQKLVDPLLEIFRKDMVGYRQCHYDIATHVVLQLANLIAYQDAVVPADARAHLLNVKSRLMSMEMSVVM